MDKLNRLYIVTVELEFVSIAAVSTLLGAVNGLETVKQENAGLMINIHYFYRSCERVDELNKLPREWFQYIHLCDAPPPRIAKSGCLCSEKFECPMKPKIHFLNRNMVQWKKTGRWKRS